MKKGKGEREIEKLKISVINMTVGPDSQLSRMNSRLADLHDHIDALRKKTEIAASDMELCKQSLERRTRKNLKLENKISKIDKRISVLEQIHEIPIDKTVSKDTVTPKTHEKCEMCPAISSPSKIAHNKDVRNNSLDTIATLQKNTDKNERHACVIENESSQRYAKNIDGNVVHQLQSKREFGLSSFNKKVVNKKSTESCYCCKHLDVHDKSEIAHNVDTVDEYPIADPRNYSFYEDCMNCLKCWHWCQ